MGPRVDLRRLRRLTMHVPAQHRAGIHSPALHGGCSGMGPSHPCTRRRNGVAQSSSTPMLHDKARIHVEGGAGGNGCVSFRREAHVPKGGPDGGDGGHGGSVVLVCDPSRRDLGALRGSKHFRAGQGRHGEGSNRHGARGEDRVIPVAAGTSVVALDGAAIELTEPGQRAVVARGGRGGHGNKRFTTSTRQAPRFAERGEAGESGLDRVAASPARRRGPDRASERWQVLA